LTLPTAELMRIFVKMFRKQTYLRQQFFCKIYSFIFIFSNAMDRHGLDDSVSHSQTGIQGRVWILKNNLQVLPQSTHVLFVSLRQIFPKISDAAGTMFQ
jgi:hypothetical protein